MRELDVISGASLAGVAFDLAVRRDVLDAELQKSGRAHLPPGGGSRVPIACELWTVTNGRAMPGGLDPEEVVGGFTGWVSGMTVATVAIGRGAYALRSRSEKASPLDLATARFEQASEVGRERGRRAARMVALPPYHELLIAAPGVRVANDPAPHVAVLAMVTDSPLARAIDRGFGYGYDKVLGHFTRESDGVVEVRVRGKLVFSARFELAGARRQNDIGADLDARWTEPLLGGIHDGRLCVAALERRIGEGGRCAAVRGDVTFDWPGVAALPTGRRRIGHREAGGIFPAAFADVTSRIARPRPV